MAGYWEKREREWIKEQQKNDIDFDKEINDIYNKSLDKIDKDISQFYTRYANKEGISISEAKKKVAEFDVKAFESTAKKMVKERDFSDEANERLQIYNATMRINRLEMLKGQVGIDLLEETDEINEKLRKRLVTEISSERVRQAGILGETVPKMTERRMEALIYSSYHGAKFSDRVWTNQDVLKNELDNIITRSLVMGMNADQLSSRLRSLIDDKIKNASYAASRIARTESARVADQYSRILYMENDFDKVKWIAEPTACSVCKPLDNKVFELMGDGDNPAPDIPVHPNCRCSTVPVDDEENEPPAPKERKNDTSSKVDANSNKLNVDISNVKGVKNYFDKKQIDEMNSMLNKAPTDIQKLYKDVFAKVPIGESTRKVAYYSQREQVVHLKRGGTYDTFFHEYAHAIDFNNGMSSSGNYGLIMSLSDDVTSYLEPYRNDIAKIKGLKKADRELRLRKAVRKAIKQKYGDGSDFDFDAIKTVSDVFKGQTNGARYTVDFDWGHDKKYYDNRSRPKEFFAETTSAIVCSPKELETIKDMLPDSYKQYQQTLEDIKKWQKEH